MIQPLLLSIQVASLATLIALLLGVSASAVLARWRSPFSVVLEVMAESLFPPFARFMSTPSARWWDC